MITLIRAHAANRQRMKMHDNSVQNAPAAIERHSKATTHEVRGYDGDTAYYVTQLNVSPLTVAYIERNYAYEGGSVWSHAWLTDTRSIERPTYEFDADMCREVCGLRALSEAERGEFCRRIVAEHGVKAYEDALALNAKRMNDSLNARRAHKKLLRTAYAVGYLTEAQWAGLKGVKL